MWIKAIAWLSLVAGALGAALALAGPLGYRMSLMHFSTGFALLRWAALAAIVAGLLALVPLLGGALLRRAGSPALIGLIALTLSLCVLLPAWLFKQKAQSVPPIHDISTDTANPPPFVALREARLAAPNGADYGGEPVARQQREAYPDIAPIRLPLPRAQAFERAVAAAREQGWEIAAAEADEGRIEAVATTSLWAFKDDVVIRLREAGPAETVVDVRSMSRVGRGDVGANAERIRAFREALLER